MCPFYCKNAGSLPEKWILLQLFSKKFNLENRFSLGLILIIDNINNISSLRSTTNRFSGPHIPMTKMLEKLLVENFFEENSRLYSFSFSKIKLCHCFLWRILPFKCFVCPKDNNLFKGIITDFQNYLVMTLRLIWCTRLEPLTRTISKFKFWQQMDLDPLNHVQSGCIFYLSKINFFKAI